MQAKNLTLVFRVTSIRHGAATAYLNRKVKRSVAMWRSIRRRFGSNERCHAIGPRRYIGEAFAAPDCPVSREILRARHKRAAFQPMLRACRSLTTFAIFLRNFVESAPGRTRTCDPRLRRRNSYDGSASRSRAYAGCHAQVPCRRGTRRPPSRDVLPDILGQHLRRSTSRSRLFATSPPCGTEPGRLDPCVRPLDAVEAWRSGGPQGEILAENLRWGVGAGPSVR